VENEQHVSREHGRAHRTRANVDYTSQKTSGHMKNRTVLNGFLAIVTVLVIGSACSSYGTKLEFNGDELFYTDNVTEADAKKLGDYLVKLGLLNDLEVRRSLRILAVEISVGAFNRAATEIHACDDQLKTCKVIPFN
jgi:hypothetical protein